MPRLIDRLEKLVEYIKSIYSRSVARFNETGDGSIMYDHKLFAVYEYINSGNPEDLRKHLRKATEFQIKLFERYEAGQETSFISDSSFDSVFYALASGDFALSKRLMEHVYRNNQNVEKTPILAKYFHYMFRIFLLEQKAKEGIFDEMFEIFEKRKCKSYKGYALALKALYQRDIDGFNEAFKLVMKGHVFLCRSGGEFGDSEDEIIAFWPLAILNLARFYGMDVSFKHSLLPENLLVEVSK